MNLKLEIYTSDLFTIELAQLELGLSAVVLRFVHVEEIYFRVRWKGKIWARRDTSPELG
jgi:hypothetical protein